MRILRGEKGKEGDQGGKRIQSGEGKERLKLI